MSEYIRDKDVKIRKERECWGCTTKFPKGTIMNCIVSKDCGEVFNTYTCAKCVSCEHRLDAGEPVFYGWNEE